MRNGSRYCSDYVYDALNGLSFDYLCGVLTIRQSVNSNEA